MLSSEQIQKLQSSQRSSTAPSAPMDSASFAQWAQPSQAPTQDNSFLGALTGKGYQDPAILQAQGAAIPGQVAHGISQMSQHPVEALKGGIKNIAGAGVALDKGIQSIGQTILPDVGTSKTEGSGIDFQPAEEMTVPNNDAQKAGAMASNFLPVGEGAKVAKTGADLVAPLVDATAGAAKDFVKPVVDKASSIMTPEFETLANKAFPPLKNDMRDLPGRNTKIKDALTDIVNNKDSLGLVDKKGEIRLPENFTETNTVQQQRLKDIYSGYTSKLEGIDKEKFDTDISGKITSQIDDLHSKLVKENSIENRSALSDQIKELQTLRDTSPEGIQKYVESLNQQAKGAPGAPLSLKQIQAANLGGQMRNLLDSSVEKIDGPGYQDLRDAYGAHKALQNSLLTAAKKEINTVPGLTDKLTSLGVSAEGLNFLITHDPHALLVAGGVKGTSAIMKWFKSPQRALLKMYDGIQGGVYK